MKFLANCHDKNIKVRQNIAIKCQGKSNSNNKLLNVILYLNITLCSMYIVCLTNFNSQIDDNCDVDILSYSCRFNIIETQRTRIISLPAFWVYFNNEIGIKT